jgi:hypothetical protein
MERHRVMSTILRWAKHKNRKPHKCFGCGKEYPAGIIMINAAYADGGTVFSCHWCDTCREYMHRYFEPGDECSEGELYENDPEEWEQIAAEQAAKERNEII